MTGSLLSPLEGTLAYLDPGSSSLILQVILAILLGGLFILRSYWKKIKDGVRQIFTKQQDGEENDTE
jgi:hypothetical protein